MKPNEKQMILSEYTYTARKRHQCSGCCQSIEIGERYIRWSGLTDGSFYSVAYHEDCRGWEIFLNQEAGLGSDEWQSLHEFVAECYECLHDAPESVLKRFPQNDHSAN